MTEYFELDIKTQIKQFLILTHLCVSSWLFPSHLMKRLFSFLLYIRVGNSNVAIPFVNNIFLSPALTLFHFYFKVLFLEFVKSR